MPIFFVGTAWLFVMITGVICLFQRESRFLSAHLFFGSTIGFLLSFIGMVLPLSLFFLFSEETRIHIGKVLGDFDLWLSLLGMGIGGSLGVFIGSRLAFKFNKLFGLQEATGRSRDAVDILMKVWTSRLPIRS